MTESKSNTDLFLSYNRSDSETVNAIRDFLRSRGVSTFFDRDQLVAGIPWPQALERALAETMAVAVFIGPEGLGLWQKREMGYALDRQVQDERSGQPFPVIPILLPGADITTGFLFLNTWVDLRDDGNTAEAVNAIIRAIKGTAAPPAYVELEPLCPYRGLHPFREEDSAFFHGREEFSRRLLDAVLERNLVAVVGTSGSGKSSVVQAGLVHLLRSRRPPESTWDTITFVPGASPFQQLATSFVPLLNPDSDEIEQLAKAMKLGNLLATRTVTIEAAVERILRRSGGTDRLLIVADQFEELFTQTAESDRRVFLESLLQALDRCQALTVVITVRGSFYDNLISANRDLSDRIEQAVINLGIMTRDELQRAVIEPAKRVGLELEPGLVKRILDDVGNEPGNLPLLEFALSELWSRRQGKYMTHAAYEEIGRVSGAIAQRADTVFDKLSPLQQERAHRLLTRLVNIGDQNQISRASRKRTLVSELGEEAQEILKVMADSRLLVVGRLGHDGEMTAEVAHEALIHHWERLSQWLDEDREFLLWRRRLQSALAEWERTEQDEGTLLRGTPLREAERWLSERDGDLNTHEKTFIQESSTKDQKKRSARELRRKLIIFISLGSSVLFFILASFALIQSLEAFSRELTAGAHTQLSNDPELSLLLSIEAVNIKPTADAIRFLRHSLVESHVRTTIEENDIINDACLSPDGSLVITGSDDNVARVWNISTGQPILSDKLKGHQGPITSIRFNSDGSLIVTTSSDKTALVWDAITGEIRTALHGHTATVNRAAFNADETRIITASYDNTARVWETNTGRLLFTLNHTSPVISAAFNPKGDLAVTAGNDNTARIWSTATGTEVEILRGHQAPLTDAVFSPDGETIATASADNTARIWKYQMGSWRLEQELTGHSDSLNSVAFSSQGNLLATASDDRTVRVWDTNNWLLLSLLRGHKDVITHASFSSDGSFIITASRDCTSKLWVSLNQHVRNALHGHLGTVNSAEFSPDGNTILTAGSDNTARIWDVKSRTQLFQLEGHSNSLNSASFNQDGTLVVTASNDATARIWRIAGQPQFNSQESRVLAGHIDKVRMASFSPDGKFIVTASNDKTARIWATETGKQIYILGKQLPQSSHFPNLFERNRIAFNADNTMVALTGRDNSIQVWDTTTGNIISEFQRHSKELTVATFSIDGKYLITTGLDFTARIREVTTGRHLHQLQGHTDVVTTAAFSPNGKFVATGSADHSVRIWDSFSGKLHGNIFYGKMAVSKVAFFTDSTTLLVILTDNTAYAWDTESGSILRQMSGDEQGRAVSHSARIYSARFSPDGNRVVTASADNTARIWSARTGQLIHILEGHDSGIVDASFSPDGQTVVTASKDGAAGLWDPRNGQLLYLLKGHDGAVTGAAFSEDSSKLITSGDDYTAWIWDVRSGTNIAKLQGHGERVGNAEFSPDGKLVVTASQDGTALVWGPSEDSTWKIISHLIGHNSEVKAHFSPDGTAVVTAGKDGTARVWRLNMISGPSEKKGPLTTLVAECEICEPSYKEICALATNRSAHASPRLNQSVHQKYLRSTEPRYKVLSWLGGLVGQQCLLSEDKRKQGSE